MTVFGPASLAGFWRDWRRAVEVDLGLAEALVELGHTHEGFFARAVREVGERLIVEVESRFGGLLVVGEEGCYD